MAGLEKKCLVASAGFHLLLAALLVVGSAFLRPAPAGIERVFEGVNIPPQYVPDASSAVTDPRTSPAQSQPVSPANEASTSVPQRRSNLPQVSTRVITRSNGSRPSANNSSTTAAQARQFNAAVNQMFRNLSPSTSIETGFGAASAGDEYAERVRAIYTQNWRPLEAGTSSSTLAVRVSINIARDGKVLSSRILRSSGDTGVDVSVAQVLERVTTLDPFPPDVKDAERNYVINFSANPAP
jgi:TonB family protein